MVGVSLGRSISLLVGTVTGPQLPVSRNTTGWCERCDRRCCRTGLSTCRAMDVSAPSSPCSSASPVSSISVSFHSVALPVSKESSASDSSSAGSAASRTMGDASGWEKWLCCSRCCRRSLWERESLPGLILYRSGLGKCWRQPEPMLLSAVTFSWRSASSAVSVGPAHLMVMFLSPTGTSTDTGASSSARLTGAMVCWKISRVFLAAMAAARRTDTAYARQRARSFIWEEIFILPAKADGLGCCCCGRGMSYEGMAGREGALKKNDERNVGKGEE
mmetsp:Transcript_32602/g.80684  ORF Transcript_32602/g.80684 Transcript_32602/m.80684 type:complete len:275 (+) Transcript_32602:2023-2847(+)